MNEQERVEKFKELPEDIQNKLLNSSEEELKIFLSLSHVERENLDIPYDARNNLREIFALDKKSKTFDNYEEKLYDLLMSFGGNLAKNKLNKLSKEQEDIFRKRKPKKKIIQFKKKQKKVKKKVKNITKKKVEKDNYIKYYERKEIIKIDSTFGKIEQTIIRFDPKLKDYPSVRPASDFLNIKSGYVTRKLARTIVDFSLDNSFENAEIKLNEHFNLDIYKDKIKDVTYKIASNVKLFYKNKLTELLYNVSPAKKLEIQIDGVYNPIVIYDKTKEIGEKDRVKIIYKEVKHVMVKISNDIKGFHFAEIISVENFAEFLKEFKIILKLKGFTKKSKIFVTVQVFT